MVEKSLRFLTLRTAVESKKFSSNMDDFGVTAMCMLDLFDIQSLAIE